MNALRRSISTVSSALNGTGQATALLAFLLFPNDVTYGAFKTSARLIKSAAIQKLAQALSSNEAFVQRHWRDRLREDFCTTTRDTAHLSKEEAAEHVQAFLRVAKGVKDLKDAKTEAGERAGERTAVQAASDFLARLPTNAFEVASGSVASIFTFDSYAIKVVGETAVSDVELAASILDAVVHLLRGMDRPGEALIMDIIAADLRAQLNMRAEFEATELARAQEETAGIVIPRVYGASDRVLVMERIDVLHQLTSEVATRAFAALELRLCSGHLFHSDLHSGNVGVRGDAVVLLDWGSTQRTDGVDVRGLLRSSVYCNPAALLAVLYPAAGEHVIAKAIQAEVERKPEASPEDITFNTIMAMQNAGQSCDVAGLRVFIGIGHVSHLYETAGFAPLHHDHRDWAASVKCRLFALARVGATTSHPRMKDFASDCFEDLRKDAAAHGADLAELIRELREALSTSPYIRDKARWVEPLRKELLKLLQSV
jgi:hypothetical protein